MTSSAVIGLPSWKVTPWRSLMIHWVAFLFGVSSVASTKTGWPPGVSPIIGSNRLLHRAKSALLIALRGSSESELDPPLIAARSVPPRRGFPALRLRAGVPDGEPPHALSSPEAPTATEPRTAAFANSLRLRSISAPDQYVGEKCR